MKKERPVIDQTMCRMVELMLKGGAKPKEISEKMRISGATISRIRAAEFDARKYAENTTQRVKEEKSKVSAAEISAAVNAEDAMPGQMQMEMPVDYTAAAAQIEREITTEKPEMSDQVKMMRFVASQVDKVIMKLDQIYNLESQILRAVRRE